MKLRSITIKNFRSIRDLTFEVEEVGGSYTFALIGINESGKSNFLEAISLVDDRGRMLFTTDYTDRKKEVRITLNYEFDQKNQEDIEFLKKELLEQKFDDGLISQIKVSSASVNVIFDPIGKGQESMGSQIVEEIEFKKTVFDDYTFGTNHRPIRKNKLPGGDSFDISSYFSKKMDDFFWRTAHTVVFWKPDEHSINEKINLEEFANDPSISAPLFNCFKLAQLEPEDALVSDYADENDIAGQLGDEVTKHINKIWPSHPVKIKFHIGNGQLAFLVEDNKVRHKSKTIEQRSDGFRHFISFLLTVSAERVTDQMYNTLFLIDEPETHLHPKAQEYLRNELVAITKNAQENIVFFATHSNHMIDKEHISMCYKFSKPNGATTQIDKADSGILQSYADMKSYSEVNYDVFDIVDHGYHNELYGYLISTEEGREKLKGFPRNKKWLNDKGGRTEKVSLSRYVRNSIHHPENRKNKKYTEKELRESIEMMRKSVQELKAKKSGNQWNSPPEDDFDDSLESFPF